MLYPYCATCFGQCYPNGAALIMERKGMFNSINQLFIVSPIRALKKSSDNTNKVTVAEMAMLWSGKEQPLLSMVSSPDVQTIILFSPESSLKRLLEGEY
ncbi:hypothetical protein KSP39_PZI010665 [Platanthera zijinensis]|uniref:Uncharacterized protein n=1 Tax=Platanthera zijinensis TaxID=2320716 RepID=A0AAP0G698_9ASPA